MNTPPSEATVQYAGTPDAGAGATAVNGRGAGAAVATAPDVTSTATTDVATADVATTNAPMARPRRDRMCARRGIVVAAVLWR